MNSSLFECKTITVKNLRKIIEQLNDDDNLDITILFDYENKESYLLDKENILESDIYELDDAELRAERIERARRQAQQFVRLCRDPAYIVSDGKRTDVIVFRRNYIELVDNKFTDSDTLYIEKNDIEKGSKAIEKIAIRNLPVAFSIDMWFPKYRMRKLIKLEQSNLGHSLKIWIAGKRIMTARI